MKHPATIRALKAEIVTLALAWYDDPYGRRDDLKAAIVHLRVAVAEHRPPHDVRGWQPK